MESTTFVKDRDIVVPGMILAQGMEYLPSKGTYRKDEKILANRLGLVQFEGKVIKTVPLAGRYLPRKDDIVIGKVIDVLLQGWRAEINSPYESVLTLKEASSDFIQRGADLTRYFELNDWIVCQIVQVTSQNLIDISMRGPGLRKLIGGTIVEINPQKVPRVVGKRNSMLGMIKRATDCNIVVGQNGRIWLNGAPQMETIAIRAITMIERNSHRSGLTEKVKEFLRTQTGRSVEPTEDTMLGSEQSQNDTGVRHIQSEKREGFQAGSFRQTGFRRGGFRNTNGEGAPQQPRQENNGNAPAEGGNEPASNGSQEESQ